MKCRADVQTRAAVSASATRPYGQILVTHKGRRAQSVTPLFRHIEDEVEGFRRAIEWYDV
jgi:hypothetical protein